MAITISDTTPRVQYTATAGQTSFAVNFEFFANTDLKVYNGTTLLTYEASPSGATKYSVSGAGVPGGGSITLGSPGATVDDKITIYRDMSIARSTDFPTSGAFQVDSLNEELDKLAAMIQQVETDTKYSPKFSQTTTTGFNLTFPELSASKVISVNSGGTALEATQSIVDITTIAGISADVTAVSNISANVTSVASNATNINTVATNIGSVNTVAADIAKVIAVANDLAEAVSEVETVADDLNEATSEIDTVAGSITNVDTVGNAIANVNLVAGQISPTNNIGALGPISADITTLAGTSGLSTLASNSANITTCANNNANITSVGSNIDKVEDVADNIAAVNSFANTYRIASSAPTSSLDVGDLYFDTTANELKVYKSSGWAAAGSTVNGTSARFTYTISGTPTTVTGADDNSETLAYDAGFVDVYLNGVKQVNGTDVTVTSGTSVVFASALADADVVDIVAFGTFNVAAVAASAITSGTIAEARLPASALGAVWESKSADFTAEARKNYFCDTTSNTIDVTLPSGTIGDEIHIVDVSGTFDTNNLTVLYGSSKIQGASSNLVVSTERAGFTLVYYNSTQGWLLKDK